jgi:hypothetical protein
VCDAGYDFIEEESCCIGDKFTTKTIVGTKIAGCRIIVNSQPLIDGTHKTITIQQYFQRYKPSDANNIVDVKFLQGVIETAHKFEIYYN